MTRRSGSRRRFLAGLGAAGAAAIAGCSGLPFTGEEERGGARASISSDAIGPVDWPGSPFPVAVPASMTDAHETRIRRLLDDVPADPDVPNDAVAASIADDRERALRNADGDPPDGWRVDALSAWRRRRADAAEVWGAYRAATGTDDGSDVVAQRRAVRDDRGALAAGLEFRAESPIEAVLAYEPVESLLAECERHLRPRTTYPADPIAEPFRVGEALARVERARAAVTDAEGIRAAYLAERAEAVPRRASLFAVAEELHRSVIATRADVRERHGGETPPGDEDLSETVAQELFATGERRVESATDDVERAVDADDYATAVAEAGVGLAEIGAFRAAVDEIRDGGHREDPSEASIRSAAERAQAAVREAADDGGPLAARLARPSLETIGLLGDRIERGYATPRATQAELAFVDLYADAVPPAAEFVRERLT
ncbi:hypothetical protein [Halorubrum hochsteinianum]|uniref:hypothetical protein n=1 Tax=Halorubrum hochsteinianum TaxID=2949307 RepID=UPI0020369D8F|nr:hypothetical protein [Halorubrum hochsteinianum]